MTDITPRHRQVAAFVQEHVRIGSVYPGQNCQLAAILRRPLLSPLPTAEELAAKWLAEGDFRALQLGGLLSTPSGEFLAEAVGLVVPTTFAPEFNLIIEALQIAAARQRGESRTQIAKGAGVGAAVSLVVAAFLKALN